MRYQLTTNPIKAILTTGNALFKAAPKQTQAMQSPNPYPLGQVAFVLLRLHEIEADVAMGPDLRDAELERFMLKHGWEIMARQAAWFAGRSQEEQAEMEFVSQQAYPMALAQVYLDFRQLPVNTAA